MDTKRLAATSVFVGVFSTASLWLVIPNNHWISFVADFVFAGFLLLRWVFSSVTDNSQRILATLATLVLFGAVVTAVVMLDTRLTLFGGYGASAETGDIVAGFVLTTLCFIVAGWIVQAVIQRLKPAKKKKK